MAVEDFVRRSVAAGRPLAFPAGEPFEPEPLEQPVTIRAADRTTRRERSLDMPVSLATLPSAGTESTA
jgi:hypothetical protein